jgi:hypothetical protein
LGKIILQDLTLWNIQIKVAHRVNYINKEAKMYKTPIIQFIKILNLMSQKQKNNKAANKEISFDLKSK